MSNRFKVAGALVGVAAATVFGAAQAFADGPPDVDVAVFVTNPVNVTVDWVLGGGTYTFNSASCTGVSVDGVGTPEAPTNCAVHSDGTFDSIVCGTGLAFGDVPVPPATTPNTTITETSDGTVYTDTSGYVIVFVAGVGVLVDPNLSDSTGGSGPGAGVVDIAPPVAVPPLIPPNPFAPPGPVWPTGPLAGNPLTAGQLGACTNSFLVTAVVATTA